MDRNISEDVSYNIKIKSLSARRAWIEIYPSSASVVLVLSLSARRAWIEIDMRSFGGADCSVALRKESVDRNVIW